MKTSNEWLLDPGLSNRGMKCTFNGEHMATRTSQDEITHKMLFGRGRTGNTDFIMSTHFTLLHIAVSVKAWNGMAYWLLFQTYVTKGLLARHKFEPWCQRPSSVSLSNTLYPHCLVLFVPRNSFKSC